MCIQGVWDIAKLQFDWYIGVASFPLLHKEKNTVFISEEEAVTPIQVILNLLTSVGEVARLGWILIYSLTTALAV